MLKSNSQLFINLDSNLQITKKTIIIGLLLLQYKKSLIKKTLNKVPNPLPRNFFFKANKNLTLKNSYSNIDFVKISTIIVSKKLFIFNDSRYTIIYCIVKFCEEWLKIYYFLLCVKLTADWFPETCDSYTLPWAYLRILTYQPTQLIKSIVPPIFGMDLSLLILTYLVDKSKGTMQHFARYIRGKYAVYI
jgi:uncharacterized protein YggT (Ycf19 family)